MPVGPSICPLVRYIYFWSGILLFQGLQWLITAPAQPHATKIAVYTALLLLLLNLALLSYNKSDIPLWCRFVQDCLWLDIRIIWGQKNIAMETNLIQMLSARCKKQQIDIKRKHEDKEW